MIKQILILRGLFSDMLHSMYGFFLASIEIVVDETQPSQIMIPLRKDNISIFCLAGGSPFIATYDIHNISVTDMIELMKELIIREESDLILSQEMNHLLDNHYTMFLDAAKSLVFKDSFQDMNTLTELTNFLVGQLDKKYSGNMKMKIEHSWQQESVNLSPLYKTIEERKKRETFLPLVRKFELADNSLFIHAYMQLDPIHGHVVKDLKKNTPVMLVLNESQEPFRLDDVNPMEGYKKFIQANPKESPLVGEYINIHYLSNDEALVFFDLGQDVYAIAPYSVGMKVSVQNNTVVYLEDIEDLEKLANEKEPFLPSEKESRGRLVLIVLGIIVLATALIGIVTLNML